MLPSKEVLPLPPTNAPITATHPLKLTLLALVSVDQFLNLQLKNISVQDAEKYPHLVRPHFPTLYTIVPSSLTPSSQPPAFSCTLRLTMRSPSEIASFAALSFASSKFRRSTLMLIYFKILRALRPSNSKRPLPSVEDLIVHDRSGNDPFTSFLLPSSPAISF